MLISLIAVGVVICIALIAFIGVFASMRRGRPGALNTPPRGTPTEIDETT